MSAYFITATGTGVGKTVLTTALTYQLRTKGREVMAIKPVTSGFDDQDPECDTALIAQSLGLRMTPETVRLISPLRFKEPLSPNLAARREGREIEPAKLLDFCDKAMGSFSTTLIEGVGGTHVPLAPDFLVADWILDLKIPAILVTGSYLGALNHTLVTMESLEGMGIEVTAIVVSQSLDEPMPLSETLAALADELPRRRIIALPRIKKIPLFENAPDLTALLQN